jgi:hypothetical protein
MKRTQKPIIKNLVRKKERGNGEKVRAARYLLFISIGIVAAICLAILFVEVSKLKTRNTFAH